MKQPRRKAKKHAAKKHGKSFLLFIFMCSIIVAGVWTYWRMHYRYFGIYSMPLAMQGGDPYVRALMRTISASEANSDHPYTLLYGGEQFKDLSSHPDICKNILTRVNQNDCTTAAGRYQVLSSTWAEKSARYYPKTPLLNKIIAVDFSPKNQDLIIYNWLSDRKAWGGMNIPTRLQQGDIKSVLRRLSGTWTSLGYGIENNSNTHLLPQIYQLVLKEELKQSKDEQDQATNNTNNER